MNLYTKGDVFLALKLRIPKLNLYLLTIIERTKYNWVLKFKK